MCGIGGRLQDRETRHIKNTMVKNPAQAENISITEIIYSCIDWGIQNVLFALDSNILRGIPCESHIMITTAILNDLLQSNLSRDPPPILRSANQRLHKLVFVTSGRTTTPTRKTCTEVISMDCLALGLIETLPSDKKAWICRIKSAARLDPPPILWSD